MAGSKLPDGELAFMYFPDNYRWSHGMLVALSSAPWGGAEIDEVNRIGLRLKDRRDDDAAWFNEWAGEAERIEAIGHAEAANGHALTAAAICCVPHITTRSASASCIRRPPRRRPLTSASVEAFRKAAGLMTRPRIEHVEVPYEGVSLPGILVHADPVPGRGKGPVMLFLDGFDVTKEMQYFKGIPDLTARGISCCCSTDRATARRSASATCRCITRPSAMPARPTIISPRGPSSIRNGSASWRSRSAAITRRARRRWTTRFACCISWGAEWDYYTKWKTAPRAYRARREDVAVGAVAAPAVGVRRQDREEAFKKLEGFKLDGVIQKMRCPYLLVHGEGDEQAPIEDARAAIEACGSARQAHEGVHARRGRLPPLPDRQRQHRHRLHVGLAGRQIETAAVIL